MKELVFENYLLIISVSVFVCLIMSGLFINSFIKFSKLMSQITVYHLLSITENSLFVALRDKGIVPNEAQLKIQEITLCTMALLCACSYLFLGCLVFVKFL